MSPVYAPAKKMIEEGVRVAIATDYNPGSSPTENLQTAMSMACYKMKLSPAQILRGVTLNAARYHYDNRNICTESGRRRNTQG